MKFFEFFKWLLSFFYSSKDRSKTSPTNSITEKIVPIVFACFSDQDKNDVINVLRPLIKNFNSNSVYLSICQVFVENKILKTFASLSEDRKTLTITLTQSSVFNEKISEFINTTVVKQFQNELNEKMTDKYQVTAKNGSILIQKLQE